MANTVTQRTLHGAGDSRYIIKHIYVKGDGSGEVSNVVVYDNSAFINDTSRGSVWRVSFAGADMVCRLDWDQTTKSPLITANPVNSPKFNFSGFGGISNPNGTGATGDIVLSTTGLASGEEVTIILMIRQ